MTKNTDQINTQNEAMVANWDGNQVNVQDTQDGIIDKDTPNGFSKSRTANQVDNAVNDTSFQCYIFLGNVKTSTEEMNLDVFVEELCDGSSVMYVTDGEPIKEKTYCTQKSLDEFQEFIDEEEMTHYGNKSQRSMNSTIFCIIETDKEKRIKYLEDIKKYAGDLAYKVIFLTYLDSLFLEKLKEHDIKLTDALYAPYISNAEFETIGVLGDYELSAIQSVNQERLEDVYGVIMDLFENDFVLNHVGFAVGIHTILLKGSYDYLTNCFQQHIIKYGTMVNMSETQINEVMESFGFDKLIGDGKDHATVILPDAYEDAKIIGETILPKHSIVSAAVVSESNRIDDMVLSAAKVIISNKISKIGVFGIPEGQNIYARFINGLTQTLENHVKETSLSQEPFKYKLYLIDHCNEKIDTPEESIQMNFAFELAIVCDNKYFTTNDATPGIGMEVVSYLEDAKKKYTTLDINTGIVYSPALKVKKPELEAKEAKEAKEGDTLNANI